MKIISKDKSKERVLNTFSVSAEEVAGHQMWRIGGSNWLQIYICVMSSSENDHVKACFMIKLIEWNCFLQ